MELENLVKLIQTVSDSDLTGFQYEENGVKLKIQKEKEQMVVSTGAAQLTTVQNVPGAQSNAVSALKSEDGPEKGKEAEGQLIKSPLFVAVGDHVSKGQTVAIVEAMKLMNDIECDFDGVVSEVLVKNGETVEYGQPLFRIA